MLLATHHDSLVGSIDLDHVKRGSRGNPQALALAHGEIMNAAVLADHFPARCYQLSRSIRQTFATVSQVGIDEPLVIAARNKTYLLRIGLLGQRQAVLAGKLAHLRLRQIAQGEKRSAKLLLRESEEEIGLILAAICGTLKQHAAAGVVVLNPSIVSGSDTIGANLLRDNQQLIELQMIVAEAARDGRAPREIFGNKGTHYIALKALFMIDNIVRDANVLGDTARVMDIVERTTAAGHILWHSLMSSQPPLVPELHGQADDVVPLCTHHGRDGGGIHTAR